MDIIIVVLIPAAMTIVSFVIICIYVNRCVSRLVVPLARRVSDLEQERDDWKYRHEALAKLYENLQRLYDGLRQRYTLLYEWAEGLAGIITDLGRDYPAPPSEIYGNHNHKERGDA
jgi:hypothetical protein